MRWDRRKFGVFVVPLLLLALLLVTPAHAGALTSVSVTPANPTANSNVSQSYSLAFSGATAATARCISVRFTGEGGTIPAPSSAVWQFQGGATTDGTKITLNSAGQTFVGSIATYRAGIPSEGFHATFDGYMGGGGGADGMTFAFLNADGYGGFAGSSGGGLGYTGLSGVAVAMDTFQNGSDPSSNFMGIATGGTGSDLTYVATNTSVPSLRTTRTYDITYNAGVLVVKVDNVQYFSQAVTVPAKIIPAFTAGTGGASDEHSVTNVVMTYQGGGASGSSPTMPGGMVVSSGSALTGSTAVTAASWGTATQTADRLSWTNAGGQVVTDGTLVITNVAHNPALAGTYYAQLTTYSNVGCSTVIDSAAAAFAITDGVRLDVTVDPVLLFSVAGYNAGTCNGATIDVAASTSTAVSLGNISDATTRVAGQALSTTTNAPSGYTVSVRYTGALSDGLGNTIADWTGTNANPTAFPGAGTSAFAYTTDHALSAAGAGPTRFQSNKWAALTTSAAEVAFMATGYVSDTTHVCYQVAAAPSTKAGRYTTTVVYTAVPLY